MGLGWIAPIVLVGVCVLSFLWSLLTAPRFNVRGLHVVLTGAENPLGLAIAKKYIKKGAKVSLLGPSIDALKAAQSELVKLAGDDPAVFVFECELVDTDQVQHAIQEANAFHGRPTDHVVYGSSRRIAPGHFWEQDLAQMKEAMDVNYLGAVVLIKAALPAMIEAKVQGRVILVSTVDSLEPPVGCAACSGSKSALRGLADTLRNELLLYNMSVSIFYPGTSSFNLLNASASAEPNHVASDDASVPNDEHLTAGYATFPESSSTASKAFDKRAQILINGLWMGHYAITTTWNGYLLRMLINGVQPRNNTPLEFITLFFVGWHRVMVNAWHERSLKKPTRAGTAASV